jgi:2'-5' RNA ligase
MGQLAVVAFPRAKDLSPLESFRATFDPQASLIAAHVTLVFPFSPSPTLPLAEHLTATAAGFAPIHARFEPDTHAEGDYLMMEASEGRLELMRLHAMLHTGPLAGHLSSSHVFRPHVTLGCVVDPNTRAVAVSQMRRIAPIDTVLEELAVFSLERRGVDFAVPLRG